MFKPFLRHEGGSTALEYSLVASLIAVVIIAAVMIIGEDVAGMFVKAGSF